jgi:nicotinamide riboside transporter PnuC
MRRLIFYILASPPVKELISENIRAFYNWKQIERPKEENSIEYIEMKRCKRPFRVTVLFVTLVLLVVTITFMMSSACISTSELFDKFSSTTFSIAS